MSSELQGRRLAHIIWTELEKIAEAENTEAHQMLSKNPKADVEDIETDGEMENLFGTRVVQQDSERARGFPVLGEMPGHVFRPDLQGYVPNTEDPGWVEEGQAAIGQASQQAYSKGKGDAVHEMAQKKMDSDISRKVEQMRMAQQGAPPVPNQVTGAQPQPRPQRRPAPQPQRQPVPQPQGALPVKA